MQLLKEEVLLGTQSKACCLRLVSLLEAVFATIATLGNEHQPEFICNHATSSHHEHLVHDFHIG